MEIVRSQPMYPSGGLVWVANRLGLRERPGRRFQRGVELRSLIVVTMESLELCGGDLRLRLDGEGILLGPRIEIRDSVQACSRHATPAGGFPWNRSAHRCVELEGLARIGIVPTHLLAESKNVFGGHVIVRIVRIDLPMRLRLA